ncbi:transcriptional regulatory protein [Mycobacteroides abscessus subsp. abscessus]|uniref:helix-turn-helix domain-containing protein n=1 Tax=Mycobacteroides abscessus TaxID=36809 RepID=UPI000926B781|nr:helix-turn-helix domain-containing protein [Mycobacteroides abscessus]SHV17566.1 transcriptional regulatory protein [Mycobacteroides abscessus subsp. abscessus]
MASNSLGEFVKAARERAGYTQQSLADAGPVSIRWIQNIEKSTMPSERVLGILATTLRLSQWETEYLYLLARRTAPPASAPEPPAEIPLYLEAMSPNPAAYLDAAWKIEHSNSEFERLFLGIWFTPNFVYWHYVGRRTLDIVENWETTSSWVVSQLRYSMAADPDNPAITEIVDRLMPVDLFAHEWEKHIIPADPAELPWIVHDLDTGAVLTLDMRLWRPAGRNTGTLILGAIRETTDPSAA